MDIIAVSDNAIFGEGFADAVGGRVEQTVIHYVDDGLNQPEEHPPAEAEYYYSRQETGRNSIGFGAVALRKKCSSPFS